MTRAVWCRTNVLIDTACYGQMLHIPSDKLDLLESPLPSIKGKVPKKKLSVAFETMPDKVTKEQLLNIFMRLTDLDKLPSEKCLEEKDWNLKNALEYFIKLLKLNHIDLLCDKSAS